MKKSLSTLLVCLIALSASAQGAADRESVLAPVRMMFKGMKDGDSAMVHRAFLKSPSFNTVATDKQGKPILLVDNLDDFLKAVGTPHTEAYNEPIWDIKSEVDGNFAQVWASYAFYLGKTFRHCGVDAFHLFRGEDGQWRIFHLADTRTKTGCNVPSEISNQFK
jgi:hypothetical protein